MNIQAQLSDILTAIYSVTMWIVPPATLLLLLLPNSLSEGTSHSIKFRLIVAAIAVILWTLELDNLQETRMQLAEGSSSFPDILGSILTGRFLAVLATAVLLFICFPWKRFNAGFLFIICLICFIFALPLMLIIAVGSFVVLATVGMAICPIIWLLTALILLASLSFGNDEPIIKPQPPRKPEGHWEERRIPYTSSELEPYTVTRREAYETVEMKEVRETKVSKQLVLRGELGELAIHPNDCPYTMMGLRYAALCPAAPGATALLYTLAASDNGSMWMLTLLPGHDYTLMINNSPACRVAMLLPGMSLTLQDADGTELGKLDVLLRAHLKILTRQEPQVVTKYRQVEEQRFRTKVVTKYRTERVWVPA